jgi:glycosyltransferase involved in cell wall biosynthesis
MAGEGVRFVGKVDPAAMPEMLDQADIFVNASVVDNQPVSLLEAFASGLPVVSTPTGDIAAMVRHEETGCWWRRDDAGANRGCRGVAPARSRACDVAGAAGA